MEPEKAGDLSHSEKIEREVAGFVRVAKRNRALAIIMAVAFVGTGAWWLFDHTHGIPHLKKEVESAQSDRDTAFRERDAAGRERDRAFRERDDAFRAKDEIARERDKYLTVYAIVQSAADSHFTNAAPDKRVDLLLEKVNELKTLAEEANQGIPKSRLLSADALKRVDKALSGMDRDTDIRVSFSSSGEASAMAKQLLDVLGSLKFSHVAESSIFLMGARQNAQGVKIYTCKELVDTSRPESLRFLNPAVAGAIGTLAEEYGSGSIMVAPLLRHEGPSGMRVEKACTNCLDIKIDL